LVERVRFLGIYSNNQDEFYRVRIADVRRKIRILEVSDPQGAARQRTYLNRLHSRIKELTERFEAIYMELIRALARAGVFLVSETQVTEEQTLWIQGYFRQHVLPHVAPFFLGPNHTLIHEIEDDAGYLLVRLSAEGGERFAMIRLPTDKVPRFIELPRGKGRRQRTLILLDNVIRIGMADLFEPVIKYDRAEAWSVKLTRDAEYDLADEIDMSLMERMDSALDQRLSAMPMRLVYDREMPQSVLSMVCQVLAVSERESLSPGGRYHNFKDFISFPGELGRKSLVNRAMPALRSPRFAASRNVFKAIRQHDILLYFPYHDFGHFTEWLRQAAYDLKVERIQISLYRLASDSLVIKSLMDAARSGKRVEVVLELQARFDEQNNLEWARVLTDAGVKVSFGIPDLKVHAKVCLVTRREKGELARYAYFGTGNFHEKTARVYTDFGLFTANAELCHEAAEVFKFIERPYTRFNFKHLWVSPTSQREQIYRHIDREIKNAKAGGKASVRAKINNLVDDGIIAKL
ncbi:MAG: polyphosphate kinase 1, partial [Litorivicinus sp.]